MFDVVIAGAGPAGCMAAYYLPGDFKILLVDVAAQPGDKVCGGLLNQQSWSLLKRFVPDTVLDSPSKLTLRYADVDRFLDKETQIILYNTSRARLDPWLLSLLPDRIEVWRETCVVGYRDYGTYVEVELERGLEHVTAISKYLVGADGARSLVRQQMSVEKARHFIAVQDWVRPEKPLPPYFDCVFSNKVGPKFVYGYIIPKGRLAVVGSILSSEAKAAPRLHERAKHIMKDKVGELSRLARRESSIVLCPRSLDDVLLGKGRVLLVGEAAGLTVPISGEGISYALSSGEACGMAFWGARDPLEQYTQLVAPILDDMRSKLGKLRFMGRFATIAAARMPVRVLSWFGER